MTLGHVVVLRGYLCPELMCINHADAEWEGEAFCPSCEPVYALRPVGADDGPEPEAPPCQRRIVSAIFETGGCGQGSSPRTT